MKLSLKIFLDQTSGTDNTKALPEIIVPYIAYWDKANELEVQKILSEEKQAWKKQFMTLYCFPLNKNKINGKELRRFLA